MNASGDRVRILGVDFFVGGSGIVGRLCDGGLVLVPSAPGLGGDFQRFAAYREALLAADYVIPDSGLMVLLWNRILASGRPIERYSGLRFLRDLLCCADLRRAGATFWVMPNGDEVRRSLEWLRGEGFDVLTEADCYVAPYYRGRRGRRGDVEDAELLAIVAERRPAYIFVNVGSGVQEQLGWYLAQNLSYRPAIVCTGAAISFLSGGQAKIPGWADRYYLGWFLRLIRDPFGFAPRLVGGVRLIPLLMKYRDQLPPAGPG